MFYNSDNFWTIKQHKNNFSVNRASSVFGEPDDISDGLPGLDVLGLHLLAGVALRVLAQDQDGTGRVTKHLQYFRC
jgi:hypothetical protein